MAHGGSSSGITLHDEYFKFLCTSCEHENKRVEGVNYCKDCYGYCCQSCTDVHKKFPLMRNHNLIDVTQGNLTKAGKPVITEFPTERCMDHEGKIVDVYCEKHKTVGCYICIAKEHR